VHPDVCHDFKLWERFGAQLCIENMDRRKTVGRTVVELQEIFAKLPEASFCFDFGHARQVDSTMAEAHFMLKKFDRRLKQVHVSEVNTSSKHDTLSYASVLAFREVAPLLREEVPVILETPVSEDGLVSEMRLAMEALPTRHEQQAYRWTVPTATVRA
jgi:endonuclease IV